MTRCLQTGLNTRSPWPWTNKKLYTEIKDKCSWLFVCLFRSVYRICVYDRKEFREVSGNLEIHRKWNLTLAALLHWRTPEFPLKYTICNDSVSQWVVCQQFFRFHFQQHKLAAGRRLFIPARETKNRRHGSNTGESPAAELSLMSSWRLEAALIWAYSGSCSFTSNILNTYMINIIDSMC